MKLCSACLLGLECHYDGKSNLEIAREELLQEFKDGNIIPVFSEQLGGISKPRISHEIQSSYKPIVFKDSQISKKQCATTH
jgi:uncharacterized protein YbbK (DUF523 family)